MTELGELLSVLKVQHWPSLLLFFVLEYFSPGISVRGMAYLALQDLSLTVFDLDATQELRLYPAMSMMKRWLEIGTTTVCIELALSLATRKHDQTKKSRTRHDLTMKPHSSRRICSNAADGRLLRREPIMPTGDAGRWGSKDADCLQAKVITVSDIYDRGSPTKVSEKAVKNLQWFDECLGWYFAFVTNVGLGIWMYSKLSLLTGSEPLLYRLLVRRLSFNFCTRSQLSADMITDQPHQNFDLFLPTKGHPSEE
jgi:hypothetical protein